MNFDPIVRITAILGAVFGFAGFTISLLNFVRDRAKVSVELGYNWSNGDENLVLVTITNRGRRPIYVSHAALRIPLGFRKGYRYLIIQDWVQGKRLNEGDPPFSVTASHEIIGVDQRDVILRRWRRVKAQATLSTGELAYSRNQWPSFLEIGKSVIWMRKCWPAFSKPDFQEASEH
jgi:hypothetical protein